MRLTKTERAELFATRRREILRAARRVFARDGYGAADLEDVAGAMGVAKGTIYRYFRSKKALFLAVADAGMQELQELMHSQVKGVADPVHRIECAVRTFLEFFDKNADLAEIFVQERAKFKDRRKPTYVTYRDRNIVNLARTMEQIQSDGKLRPVNIKEVVGMVGDLLFGMVIMRYFRKSRRALSALVREVTDFIFLGILKP